MAGHPPPPTPPEKRGCTLMGPLLCQANPTSSTTYSANSPDRPALTYPHHPTRKSLSPSDNRTRWQWDYAETDQAHSKNLPKRSRQAM